MGLKTRFGPPVSCPVHIWLLSVSKKKKIVVFQLMEFISYGNRYDTSASQDILLKFKQSNCFLFYCTKFWPYKICYVSTVMRKLLNSKILNFYS